MQNRLKAIIGNNAALLVVGILVIAGIFYAANLTFERGPDWQTVTTAEGVSYRYPESLGTEYIDAPEWPPAVEVQIAQFLCAEPLEKIGNREYCIGRESGAAAGSRYETVTYNTMKNERMVTLRAVLRYPECANYEEPNRSGCEQERQSFSFDPLADRIIETVRF